ncbi:CD209 antigen-like protein C [Hemicordylus capensis]|uniref:CD209 antigen-like protein C n=1 Tax=Hemicordylus capensis TaxID=884348 RepID=UPI00230306B8|nr:CD209 antigen-like protein C [Hemicordylus capensis]
MSQGVTYADLRFVKAPPERSQQPQAQQEEASEGDLTYENIQVSRPREEEEGPPRSAGGAEDWQVSRQLQQASRAHERERKAQAQRIGAQEGGLERSQQLLREAEMRLSSTRAALWESWEAGNRTRRRLEEQLEAVARVQQQRQETGRRLNETEAKWLQATSCQQRGCCPPEWKLFRWKCFWVSPVTTTWERSKEACERQSSQLLVLKEPLDAGGLRDAQVITSDQQPRDYWIGLSRTKRWSGYEWVDGSHYERNDVSPYKNWHQLCVKLSNGMLSGYPCQEQHHYICEKAASSEGEPEVLPG